MTPTLARLRAAAFKDVAKRRAEVMRQLNNHYYRREFATNMDHMSECIAAAVSYLREARRIEAET